MGNSTSSKQKLAQVEKIPSNTYLGLSAEDTQQINQVWRGLDMNRVVDNHTHICGLGHNNTGCYVNRKMRTSCNPYHRFKLKAFLSACGVTGKEADTDAHFVQRLRDLIRNTKPADASVLSPLPVPIPPLVLSPTTDAPVEKDGQDDGQDDGDGDGDGDECGQAEEEKKGTVARDMIVLETKASIGGESKDGIGSNGASASKHERRNHRTHIRCAALAFDQFHDENGEPDEERTGFHVPNEYVLGLAEKYPDEFIPVVSIHPYRADAVEKLEEYHRRGVRMCKWLPNSMGIDLSHVKCHSFYDKMAELDMILLTHTGHENSVDGGFLDNELGNPLKLYSALDRGVRVIAAHCASEGWYCSHGLHSDDDHNSHDQNGDNDNDAKNGHGHSHGNNNHHNNDHINDHINDDDDDDGASKKRKLSCSAHVHAEKKRRTESGDGENKENDHSDTATGIRISTQTQTHTRTQNSSKGKGKVNSNKTTNKAKLTGFDLFIRMMDDPRYDGLLYGDISSIVAFRRAHHIETLLDRVDLHHRLVNGSDYPVPAIPIVVWTSRLRKLHLITQTQVQVLDRVFKFNPLLFDFVLKRMLKSRAGNAFSSCVFDKTMHDLLFA